MADLMKLPDDADAVITKLYNNIHAHEMTGKGGKKRVTAMREAVKLLEISRDLAGALLEAMKALQVEHAYWDEIAQSDLHLQEVAYDYPMPLKMTVAMRKADALSATLAKCRQITGDEK